jgi:hypothetical protein
MNYSFAELGDHPATPILYYEAHITIEPCFGEALELVDGLARINDFRVAELLMQKREEDTAERSKFDTFMTSRHKSYVELKRRTIECVTALQQYEFKVWRYKIEATILDTKHGTSSELI